MAKRKAKASGQPKSQPIENDDDSFGLPDIEPQPLSSQVEEIVAESEPATLPTYEAPVYDTPASDTPVGPEATGNYSAGETVEFSRPTSPPTETSVAPPRPVGLIVAGILLVVLAMVGLIYWFVVKPHQEKAKQELLAKQEKERQEQERKAIEEEERRRREAAEAENQIKQNEKPAVGAIDTLTERTKRYYVVLASSVDGDLIMDYAKKLSAKGVSTNILPPSEKLKFTRLTMGDFDTYANAQSAADAAKPEYGNNLWVIRY
jgi:hypothetical protein